MSADEAMRHDVMAVWNDAETPPDRVSFGPLPTQTMPARWAAWMLTSMRDDEVSNAKRKPFSDYLQAATVHFLMNGGE
jgi:hypothetical protein